MASFLCLIYLLAGVDDGPALWQEQLLYYLYSFNM